MTSRAERELANLQAAIDDCDSWPRYSNAIKSSLGALRAALAEPEAPGECPVCGRRLDASTPCSDLHQKMVDGLAPGKDGGGTPT